MRALLLAGVLSLFAVPAQAQMYWKDPNFQGARVVGGETGISLPMPGATPEEHSAALIWNLRAAMNVAALQCHPWPFLDAVDNYNQMLNDHGDEIRPAYDKVQKKLACSGPIAHLTYGTLFSAMRDKLQGFETMPNRSLLMLRSASY